MARTFSIGCVLTAGALAAAAGCSGKPAAPAVPATPAAVPVHADSGLPAEVTAATTYRPQPKGTLTFTKHIAPIIYQKCATCHRAGEIAPFSLLTYEDVRKRARQIVQVTARRIMPPWMPVPGYNHFEADRSLALDEIGMIEQWVAEGMAAGGHADLLPEPKFRSGWRYGEPDLVVTMPKPYELPPEGKDRLRDFVIPLPISETKYVRAFDFDPGNRRIVHHAIIRVDQHGMTRYRDPLDPVPGFEPRVVQGETPEGFFLGWAPGYDRARGKTERTWMLRPGSDLVLDLHLSPTGKPERLQSRIALYFSDRPSPAYPKPINVILENCTIDIPPEKNDLVIEDSFVMPVDGRLLSIYPHAHFLCRDMKVFAVRPDGVKFWLVRITDWDFNWQNAYTYEESLLLPVGTKVYMRFTYDNSVGNPRNPHNPPQQVRYGLHSEEEMAQVMLQVLVQNERDGAALTQAVAAKAIQTGVARAEYRLSHAPEDADAYYELGNMSRTLGNLPGAMDFYEHAVRLNPNHDEARDGLGELYLLAGRLDDAQRQFKAMVKINARDPIAHNNLGLVFLQQENLQEAASEFEEALRILPGLAQAENNLGMVALARRDLKTAASCFERALKRDPGYEDARRNLLQVKEQLALPGKGRPTTQATADRKWDGLPRPSAAGRGRPGKAVPPIKAVPAIKPPFESVRPEGMLLERLRD